MQILRARPDDAATLTEIAFAAKRHWGYPERWIESWHDVLTVDPEFIVSHETYAAVIEGQTVGFYALGQKGDRVDLMHMWVLPNAMGRGVGRSLFLHALERTRVLGFRELEIESDPNAEGFYQHLGARRVGSSIRIGLLEYRDVIGSLRYAKLRSDTVNMKTAPRLSRMRFDNGRDEQASGGVHAYHGTPGAPTLLTCKRDAAGIIEQHRVCRTTTLQLVDRVIPDELRRI